MPFTFTAPAPAGDSRRHRPLRGPGLRRGSGTVWVGHKDLRPLPPSPNYALIGATGTHSDNHYLTDTATSKLNQLAERYRERFPDDPVLHLNDTSLERGVVLDIYRII